MFWGRLAPGFCGVALVVVIGLAWSISEFGAPRYAWLYASGMRVVVERASIQVPDGKPGDERDAAFLVHNLSGSPVRIVGVTISCGCISSAERLPVTVPPRGIKELRLTLHLEESATGAVEQVVTYHTDEPTAPSFAVKVSGRVVDP